ncbi:MAG TPA: BTAD domain-containing putative transcriptional regulator [Actinocrinis sp.]|jgi:DNA-binding SARP family transcriptional activator
MLFSVLGPLRVSSDGVACPVAGARQRAVLGALLASANQPVRPERLAEIVWEGRPSAGSVATLRSYVMRLRRGLEPEAASRIVTSDAGYVIEVAEAEVDALRFEALCREAGAAIESGLWIDALDRAVGALGLWRGAPLADIPCRALHDVWVPRLEQLRLQTMEWRIEAELHLGRHDHVVPELRDLIARYPLRERFHAQLMLALAGTGRQSEALDAYLSARRVLVGELGIEPGLELRTLQQRVLAGDPELAAPLSYAEAESHAPSSPSAQPQLVPQSQQPAAQPRHPQQPQQQQQDPPTQPPAPPQQTPVIPRQLPADVRHFTGRRPELDALVALLEDVGPEREHDRGDQAFDTVLISAIDGMAGIGKTSLAVHAAHRLADRFPDGQLFLDLHGHTRDQAPRSAGEALDVFLAALGVPAQQIPRDLGARAAVYRQRLADTRTLILLDNAADEAQIRPLLPGSAGCLVLVTSRRRLKGLDDAYSLALDVLPPAEAAALFRRVAGPGRARADEPVLDEPVLDEVTELCGRLPLALRIAASLLRHRSAWTLEHLAGLLRDERRRVGALSDGERDLAAVFDLSYQGLTEPEQGLLRHLGLLPGADTDAYAAAALADLDPVVATRLLEGLVDHNLLIEHAVGRYRLHDLVRLYAAARALEDPRTQHPAALDRLLDYYQHTAQRASARRDLDLRPKPSGPAPAYAPEFTDADAAFGWLRAERANLLACLDLADRQDWGERVVALSAGLSVMMITDGPWPEAIELNAVAAETAQRLGDRAGHADALTDLGGVRLLAGDPLGAVRGLQQALEFYAELGDRRGRANALTELGQARVSSGDHVGAVRDLQEALELYQSLGIRLGRAKALTRLGYIRHMTGDYPGAIGAYEESLDLHREVGAGLGLANTLTRLAQVQQSTGDYHGSIGNLQEALDLYRALDNRLGQSTALVQLGQARTTVGDPAAGIANLEQALELCRAIGSVPAEGNTLIVLGNARRLTGDLAGAARDLEAGLAICREIGFRANEGWAMNYYAAVFLTGGDLPRALSAYQDALMLSREVQHPDDEGLALEGIGECRLRTGEPEAGADHLNQALAIFRRLGMQPDADRVVARLNEAGAPPA